MKKKIKKKTLKTSRTGSQSRKRKPTQKQEKEILKKARGVVEEVVKSKK